MAAAAVAEIRNTVTTATRQSAEQSVISTSLGRSNPPMICQSPQALHIEPVKFESHAEAFPLPKLFRHYFFGWAGLHAGSVGGAGTRCTAGFPPCLCPLL